MTKRKLLHPDLQSEIFGMLPALRLASQLQTPKCPIFLYEGRHIGPNRGFGAKHIWAEHQKEIIQYINAPANTEDMTIVSLYVSRLLQPHTPLFYEACSYKNTRINAVRVNTGTCILQFENKDAPYWHVITAFNRRQGKGAKVGQI